MLEKNKHRAKKQNDGRGTVGRTAVNGQTTRREVAALVIDSSDTPALEAFVIDHIQGRVNGP